MDRRFAKSVVYTIITNAGPPNTIHHTPAPDRVPEITRKGNACRRYDASHFGLRALVGTDWRVTDASTARFRFFCRHSRSDSRSPIGTLDLRHTDEASG